MHWLAGKEQLLKPIVTYRHYPRNLLDIKQLNAFDDCDLEIANTFRMNHIEFAY